MVWFTANFYLSSKIHGLWIIIPDYSRFCFLPHFAVRFEISDFLTLQNPQLINLFRYELGRRPAISPALSAAGNRLSRSCCPFRKPASRARPLAVMSPYLASPNLVTWRVLLAGHDQAWSCRLCVGDLKTNPSPLRGGFVFKSPTHCTRPVAAARFVPHLAAAPLPHFNKSLSRSCFVKTDSFLIRFLQNMTSRRRLLLKWADSCKL